MKKIYQGIIRNFPYRDNDEAVFLGDDEEPLASIIEQDIDDFGCFLSVRYFISDKEKSIDKLTEDLIKKICGVGNSEYSDAYSECTGYLWTNQELDVGGHDLIAELDSNVGKYLYLEIDYSNEPKQ